MHRTRPALGLPSLHPPALGHDAKMPQDLFGLDWANAAAALSTRGWVRLETAVPLPVREALADAAPDTWSPLKELEYGVRQGGLTCGAFVEEAKAVVQSFASDVGAAVGTADPALPALPPFNEVQWGRDNDGAMFITPHRDPPTAGGIIAVLNIWGAAQFRLWDDQGLHEWRTDDGDLVLLGGAGWPTADRQCPLHEAALDRGRTRMTMTLRHNKGGAGADYFSHKH